MHHHHPYKHLPPLPHPHPPLPPLPTTTPVQGALCDDDPEVRTAAGGVFNVLFKSGGGSAMDSVIPALLAGLDSDAHGAQVGARGGMCVCVCVCACVFVVCVVWWWWAVWGGCPPCVGASCQPGGAPGLPGGVAAVPACLPRTHLSHTRVSRCPLPPPHLQALEGLRVVLGVRPQLLSVMVPRLIKPPVTSTSLRALGALAEVAGGAPSWRAQPASELASPAMSILCLPGSLPAAAGCLAALTLTLPACLPPRLPAVARQAPPSTPTCPPSCRRC